MHKSFYGVFIVAFIFSTVWGNIPNTDLEEAILYSDLASVKKILSTTKSFNAQEQKAYLTLALKEIDRTNRLLNNPTVYWKIAPGDAKSKILSAITILTGVASLSLFVGSPLIKNLNIGMVCLLAGSMGMLITPLLDLACKSHEITRCSATAYEYYRNAQTINSLLNKVPLTTGSTSLLTYNQTELNVNIHIDVA